MVFGVGFDPDKGEHMVQRDPRSSNRFYVSRSAGAEVFAVLAAFKTRTELRRRGAHHRLLRHRPVARRGGGLGRGQPVGETSDDRGRKSDLVFGYLCQAEKAPISAARATGLIRPVALVRPR
jgi:hypothetical protein